MATLPDLAPMILDMLENPITIACAGRRLYVRQLATRRTTVGTWKRVGGRRLGAHVTHSGENVCARANAGCCSVHLWCGLLDKRTVSHLDAGLKRVRCSTSFVRYWRAARSTAIHSTHLGALHCEDLCGAGARIACTCSNARCCALSLVCYVESGWRWRPAIRQVRFLR